MYHLPEDTRGWRRAGGLLGDPPHAYLFQTAAPTVQAGGRGESGRREHRLLGGIPRAPEGL